MSVWQKAAEQHATNRVKAALVVGLPGMILLAAIGFLILAAVGGAAQPLGL